MAIVSLIAGVVSWFALPLLAGIVAVVTGHMARNQIRVSFGRERGDGLALVGLILGYLNLVVSCLLPLLIFGGVISVGGVCSICAALTESGNTGMSPLPFP
jgi:hypothetical protein